MEFSMGMAKYFIESRLLRLEGWVAPERVQDSGAVTIPVDR